MRKKYGDWRDGSSFPAFLWALWCEPTFKIGLFGLIAWLWLFWDELLK